MDQASFSKFRRCSRTSFNFVTTHRPQILVKSFTSTQLSITNNYFEVFRKRKFSMEEWEQNEDIKHQLIGISPQWIALRPPMGNRVVTFLLYYKLHRSPVFFYDLEIETLAPILKSISPLNIRICYNKVHYDEKLFGLETIKNAQNVRCDYFLGLPDNVHPLVAERVHDMKVGFTQPPPIRFLRTLVTNFFENRSVIKILEMQTFFESSTKGILSRILLNIPRLERFRLSPKEIRSILHHFSNPNINFSEQHSVRLIRTHDGRCGFLFVSSSKIVFATSHDMIPLLLNN